MSKVAVNGARSQEAARVRLTLDISQKLNAIVDNLALENDTTKADVLRFAVEILSAATEAKKSGMHVGAWAEKPDGSRQEREFIGL